jgi:hypothetical protein
MFPCSADPRLMGSAGPLVMFSCDTESTEGQGVTGYADDRIS